MTERDDEIDGLVAAIRLEVRAIRDQLLAVLSPPAPDDDDPPRCPRCGCYQFVYQGDKQVCRDCGRE